MQLDIKISKSFFYQLLICSCLIILFLIISNVFYGFFRLGDDTYIYLQYARSLIQDNEIAFNSGEPSYGFTSPLWLFLLVTAIKISGSYLHSPHLLTLFFSVISIIVWFVILEKFQLNVIVKYLVQLLVVLDPNLLKHSYLGMEASASFFLSSVIVLLVINYQNKGYNKMIAVIFGFYFLIRPESCLIYFIIIFVFYFSKNFSYKNVLIMLFISSFIVLPWLLFSYFYFGSILPTTFSAKGASYELGTKFFIHILDSIKIFSGNYLLVISAIIISLLKFGRSNISDKFKEFFSISILSIIGLVGFYSLILNREIVFARYYCMVFPFIYLLLVIGLTISDKLKLKWVTFSLVILLLYSVIVTVVFSNLTKSFYQDELLEDKVVSWVINHSKDSDLIVRSRIGKIAFYSERKIIDPIGIINPDIIEFNREDRTFEYYAKIKPRYFIGSFDIQIMTKYGDVEMVEEFKGIKRSQPRNFLSGKSELKTIPIYKVGWY